MCSNSVCTAYLFSAASGTDESVCANRCDTASRSDTSAEHVDVSAHDARKGKRQRLHVAEAKSETSTTIQPIVSARARPPTRSSSLAETKLPDLLGEFLIIKLEVTKEQLRPFGVVRLLSGALDKQAPRNPHTQLVGEVWVPVDITDLFGSYCVSSSQRTQTFLQGHVKYFNVTLDQAGRFSHRYERGLVKEFGSAIEDYHTAALEADLIDVTS